MKRTFRVWALRPIIVLNVVIGASTALADRYAEAAYWTAAATFLLILEVTWD